MSENMEFKNPRVVAAIFERASRRFREGVVDPVEPEMAAVEAAAHEAPEEREAATEEGRTHDH
ncbi:MAG: hypothetical protein IOC54_01430 [Methylobacterium sp.]|nr:hypothetical protein [Methylobacterium sp.]MCA3650482.1 hypothetical protein [Methylobacterium sp.]MCA4923362.1 hypothetical protein [Methylobacterium sp.]